MCTRRGQKNFPSISPIREPFRTFIGELVVTWETATEEHFIHISFTSFASRWFAKWNHWIIFWCRRHLCGKKSYRSENRPSAVIRYTFMTRDDWPDCHFQVQFVVCREGYQPLQKESSVCHTNGIPQQLAVCCHLKDSNLLTRKSVGGLIHIKRRNRSDNPAISTWFRIRQSCPSSKHLGRLSLFWNRGSGSFVFFSHYDELESFPYQNTSVCLRSADVGQH